jgi:hypothetical protein
MPPVHSRSRTSRPVRFSQTLQPEKRASVPQEMPALHKVDAELLEVTPLDIRCHVSTNPEIGEELTIMVAGDGGGMLSVSGIVHWKEIRRSGFEVGLYLTQGLPAALARAVTNVRRQSNRYRCRLHGQISFAGQKRNCAAAVVNYNHDGFAVETEVFCKVDDVVQFEWMHNDSVNRVSGQVLWQIEQQNGVLLGCQTQPGDGYRIAGLDIA